ncbi:hypothetical protein BN844_5059 [Pseudomonas sp. SHC52]|nr:hypothetical protein BN844_5059 [Pseudomonas sp. SHC52]
MFKVTPNPPTTDPTDSTSFDNAAKRALDFYLKPEPPETKSDPLFTVANGIDTECLLANLSETLASANAMAADLAFDLDGSRPWASSS